MSAVTDLTDPLFLSLLSTHPNQLLPAQLPFLTQSTPLQLIHAYTTGHFPPSLPPPLRTLIHHIRTTQLPRTPIALSPANVPSISTQGMSPKKLHEVLRMASYVASLAQSLTRTSSKPLHIIDVGAGQGYLTRTLKLLLPSAHILALDADHAQSVGAQRWEARLLPNADPPITHRVLFITPDSLIQAVDDWTSSTSEDDDPVPVLFIALHACGSLTPAILHAFICASQFPSHHTTWYPAALVAVGCCYNLIDPSDYPKPTQHLPISAYHLAAQIPGTWLFQKFDSDTEQPILDPAVELAIRKVTWRAMLNLALEHASPSPAPSNVQGQPQTPLVVSSQNKTKTKNKSATVPARWNRRPSPNSAPPQNQNEKQIENTNTNTETDGIGITTHLLRLGKLKDSAYETWNGFLDAAGEKMGVVFREEDYEDEEGEEKEEGHSTTTTSTGLSEVINKRPRKRKGRDKSHENALGVLHVLRCLLGPLIESVILRDRVEWVREGLGLGVDSEATPSSSMAAAGTSSTMTDDDADADNPNSNSNKENEENENKRKKKKKKMRVELVNLFDQTTGSGRNVAIVIAPEDIEGVFLSPPPGPGHRE